MHDEREGYLEILSRITTEEEFFSLVLEICGNYGFEFFSFGARAPFPLTAPKYHFLSNYPGEWKSRYISEDYTSIDPIVRHGLLEYTPLIWNGEDFQENRFFWEEALHHGIRHGWSIPVRGKYGLISMLSLVRSSESIAATEILEKESLPALDHQHAAGYLRRPAGAAHRPGKQCAPDRQGKPRCSSGPRWARPTARSA